MDQYGNLSPFSATDTNTTNDYCAPNSLDSKHYNADNFISQVKLKTLSFPYASQGPATVHYGGTYNNFSGNSNITVPTLFIGGDSASNILSVTVANKSLTSAHFLVAIDFDYNGVFDVSEQIPMGSLFYNGGILPNIASMSGSTIAAGIPVTFVSGPIKVPLYAYEGKVKMRIMYARYAAPIDSQQFNSYNRTCDFLTFGSISASGIHTTYIAIGEIEDYDVLLSKSLSVSRTSTNIKAYAAEDKPSVTSGADAINSVLYPNPVSGDIMNITLVDDNTPYRIINILGQEVGVGTVKNSTISVEKLNSGTYLVEILVENQRIVKRFIKQ
ncbi:T9SS type A sorting domain-containing protein [Flavobacterium sp. XS1P32]|uniref:T9SS type A sorting domain-containing protein n=1 Tax=unclassified Flavobacterium TaxID=196869 RepID=UPI003AAD5045